MSIRIAGETRFRERDVLPFLRTLKNSHFIPIQQMSFVGDPDFVGCVHGRFVALELKDDSGSVRPIQRVKLDKIRAAHGVSLVAMPANWAGVKDILIQLDEGEQLW